MSDTETAILAGGCFWCTEAVFRDVIGVTEVESGYIGGTTANPTYKQVCAGDTGHAEAIRVTYDPTVISYAEVLDVFLGTHDPTQLNRQGNDIGTQYRSAIYYHSPEQRDTASAIIAELTAEKAFADPIVTEITEAGPFYLAEPYHQEYYARNPGQGYCQFVVAPKLAKFRKHFAEKSKAAASAW